VIVHPRDAKEVKMKAGVGGPVTMLARNRRRAL
jgi:hypothetical protein